MKSKNMIVRQPSYVMNAEGKPEAVLLDIESWQTILGWLEDRIDQKLIHQATRDLQTLSKGEKPIGWQSWEAFEAELDSLEQAGELPD